MGFPLALSKTDMRTALGETGQVDVILSTKIYPQGKTANTQFTIYESLAATGKRDFERCCNDRPSTADNQRGG